MSSANLIQPFVLAVADETLIDLKRRLEGTRWPEESPLQGWQQGVPLRDMRKLCEYWLGRYDWRRCEAMLNGFGQYRTVIDGIGIHFLHVRSAVRGALPLLLTHGWPGSVIEFCKTVGPLTDPVTYGGQLGDAFDLIIPSLPGFGFSDKPIESGWSYRRIAKAWLTLVKRLG